MATNDSHTLTELLAFVEEAGGFYAPGFSATLKTSWINAAILAWADWILECDDTRFMKEGTIAVASGTDTYDLKDNAVLSADDFYRARGLCVADTASPSGYSRLQRMQWSQRHDYSYSTDKRHARWDVIGDKLTIWPKPAWSANALIEYVPLQQKLVSGSDSVDLRNSVTFVVTYACMHLAPRDGSSKKSWSDLHDAAKLAIRQASPQNIGGVKRAISALGNRRLRGISRQRT